MRLFSLAFVGALLVGCLVGLTGTAGAEDNRKVQPKLVRMQDDCDPRTFNEVLGDGACVGEGDTTFQELFAQLERRGEANKWRNTAERLGVRQGTRLRVVNQGGEAHSFTQVRRFGPGCVPELNDAIGFPPGAMVRECRSPAWLRTLRPAGGSLKVANLRPGKHRFQCLIHPWMRTTVEVRSHHH